MLPTSFLDSLKGLPGFHKAAFEEVHEKGEQITSIRLNGAKPIDKNAHPFLNNTTPVPWCNEGLYLAKRPLFVLDPLWHAGAYYVQEASSMFIDYVLMHLGLARDSIVLDLCAAPGGKSTLLANYFNSGLVVANETIKSRNAILVENLTKWGADNMVVTQSDPAHFKSLPLFFDVMMIDAPCSGSGLFRKDATAIKEWSEDQVQHCSLRQQRIIEESLDALKVGGHLFYSTCSYSFDEDEKMLDLIANLPGMVNVVIPLLAEWKIVPSRSPHKNAEGYRFYPDQIKGEGFFIAVFKKDSSSINERALDTFKLTPSSKNELAVMDSAFKIPFTHQCITHQNNIIAIPKLFDKTILTLLSHLYIKKMGLTVGEVKGKDFIPSHALAMSFWTNLPYETRELDIETALNYLRRSPLSIDGNMGWRLLCFQHRALGWAKVLPNRLNNYYPNEWRILNY